MSRVLQYLLDLVARLGPWSYVIIFAAAALECAAFAGLIIPGESLVLASGFFAHQGLLRLDAVLLATALGAVAGDNIGYYLGRRLGRDWLLRHGSRFGLRQRRLDQAESFFRRHGPKAVFVGRFVGFARALVPFVAGTSRMPYRQFLRYNALGAVLWTLAFVTLGYVLGASWQVAERWIGRTSLVLAAAAVLMAAVVWYRRRTRTPRPPERSDCRRLFLLWALLLLGGCGDGTGPGGGDPTGNRIAFLASGNVWSMREDGSNQVMLTRDTIGPYDGASGPLSWSPDGTHLLVELTRSQPGGLSHEAAIVAGDGSGYRVVSSDLYGGLDVGTWSPDGRWITFDKALEPHALSSGIFTASADGTGETHLDTDPPPFGGSRDLGPAWSPTGEEIAFVSYRPLPPDPAYRWHLFSIVLRDTTVVPLSSGIVMGFRWAPDGQRLMTLQGEGAYYQDRYFFSNCYLLDRASGGSTRLSPQDNVDGLAEWSPDGSRLAFTSIRDGNVEIYVMKDDGSGVLRLTNDPADDLMPAWSPDGTRLVFQSNRDGNWEIYTTNVDGTGLSNLTRTPSDETAPAWR
jgi:membrane protein DedA with SNARE-associated domain/Tol biopolymer transport system component